MAVSNKPILDSFLDDAGNALPISGEIVIDKKSGKSFSEHVADAASHPTRESISQLITTAIEPVKTALDTFLSGDPDDNGTVDRLKELVQLIVQNKESIDAIVELNKSGTGIAFVDSGDAKPVYDGKIRLVVGQYTPGQGE